MSLLADDIIVGSTSPTHIIVGSTSLFRIFDDIFSLPVASNRDYFPLTINRSCHVISDLSLTHVWDEARLDVIAPKLNLAT